MLKGKVEYKLEGKTYSYRCYVLDEYRSSIVRLVGVDSDSANLLMDNQFGKVQRNYRTILYKALGMSVERLFAAKELVVDDVDWGSPKNFKTLPSFEFLASLYCIYQYAKTVKDVTVSDVGLEGFDSGDVVRKTEFSTNTLRGYVERKLGVIVGLEVISDTCRISLKFDEGFSALSSFEKIKQMGTDKLVTDFTKLKVDIPKELINSFCGVPTEKKVIEEVTNTQQQVLDLTLEGVSSISPFYETVDEVVASHPDKNFGWIRDRIAEGAFHIVKDVTLVKVIEQLKRDYEEAKYKYVALDTETTGLDFTFRCFTGQGSEVVGFVIAAKPGTSYYFPIGHKKIPNLCGGDINVLIEKYLKPLLEKWNVVCHNNEFDWMACYSHGLVLNTVMDTMVILRKTLVAVDPTLPYGLKGATEMFLKRDSPELDDLCKNGDFNSVGATFADLPEELVAFYACPDADNTLSLMYWFIESGLMDKYNAWRCCENDSKFTSVIAYSRFYGQMLDLSSLPKLREYYGAELEKAQAKLYSFLRETLPKTYDLSGYKPSSGDMNKKIAYDILKYPVQLDASTKRPTLNKQAIKVLSSKTDSDGKPLYPFVALLKDVRDTQRIFDAFLKEENIKKNYASDGVAHSRVDQFKVTGRLGTSGPNYQGYADIVKQHIIARPGYAMYDFDYSSKENWVIAVLSKEESLMDMFRDWRNDYHRFQASRMHGILQEQVTPDLRGESKGIVFGINYGMSDASLGERLFRERTPANTSKAAAKRELFFSFQPNVRKWFDNNVATAMNHGYSETVFGSRRFYDSRKVNAGQIRRYALNHPIQGSAADIYKAGMVDLLEQIKANGYLGKFLLSGFIHDEGIFEVDKSIHPHIVLGMLRRSLRMDFGTGCFVNIGFGIGKSWYEAKKTEWPVGMQELLENRIDAYAWDGDVDKYIEYTHDQIHRFNAYDVCEMLKRPTYYGGVFPIAYMLEMQNFILPELKEKLPLVSKFFNVDLEELIKKKENSSAKEFSGYLTKLFITLHIKERLELFKVLVLGYDKTLWDGIPEGIETKFIDLTEVEEVKKTDAVDDYLQEQERKEKERQVRLIKNQISDFGIRLDMDRKIVYLYHSPKVLDLLRKIFADQGVANVDGGYKVRVYDEKTDNIQELAGYSVAEKYLQVLSANARSFF